MTHLLLTLPATIALSMVHTPTTNVLNASVAGALPPVDTQQNRQPHNLPAPALRSAKIFEMSVRHAAHRDSRLSLLTSHFSLLTSKLSAYSFISVPGGSKRLRERRNR